MGSSEHIKMGPLGDYVPRSRKYGRPASVPHAYTGVPREEDAREAKPWQRVIFELGRKGTHLYEPVKSVPSTLLVLLLGVYLLLAFLTQLIEDDLVKVVREADLAADNSETFSEEAAWRYLSGVVGEEPRVAGTLYHLQKTRDLKATVDAAAAAARLPVHTDWQLTSGDYYLNYTAGHANRYQNVSNIIAVLEGESGFNSDGTTNSSILVNCHYDSVPFALGASDNAVFCAVMLETLAKLAQRRTRLRHNVVFLFNGAEENTLQGSHAFLSHAWFAGVTSVVNLDAAGMNGKATLFQVSDPRALRLYRSAAHKPSAQAFGEFLFSSGIIPSDTDFRIWRDFGHVHGIDIAFVKWGHVYHTRHDNPSLIRDGVMQYAGNLLLNLVSEMAATQELETKIAPSAAVYYDYASWFLVVYSYTVAIVVDTFIVLLAVLSVVYYVWLVGMRWSSVRELAWSAAGRLAAVGGGLACVAAVAPLSIALITQLRYLRHAWIVVPVVWVPYVIGCIAASQGFDAWRAKKSGLNRSIRCAGGAAATRGVLALAVLVLLLVPGTATIRYVLSVPLALMSLAALLSLTVYRIFRLQGWQHLLMEVVLSLPAMLFVNVLTLRIDALMLPIMGRTPTDIPDYIVLGLNLLLALLTASVVSGVELLFSRRRLAAVLGGALAVCVVIAFVPMSPYSDTGVAVQRHYWFHTEIVSHDFSGAVTSRTSGVLVTKHDVYTISGMQDMLNNASFNLQQRTDFADDCRTKVYCDLPLYRTRFGDYLADSLFLYTGPPAAFSPPPSVQRVARSCAGTTCELSLNITGAPHNLVTLWPRDNVSLTGWSLASPLTASLALAGRPVYSLIYSVATYSDTWDDLVLNLTLTVPPALQSGALLDVSHHAHRIQHPQLDTAEYRALLAAAPPHFHVSSFHTLRHNLEL